MALFSATRWLTLLFCASFLTSAYAADPTAKEDLTPPPAEAALTVAQIPLITSANKPAPTSTPKATNETAPPTTSNSPISQNIGPILPPNNQTLQE